VKCAELHDLLRRCRSRLDRYESSLDYEGLPRKAQFRRFERDEVARLVDEVDGLLRDLLPDADIPLRR